MNILPPLPSPLSESQEKVLQAIVDFHAVHGYPPAIRDICKATGLTSSSTVWSHLRSLQEAGYIRRDPLKPRALVVTDPRREEQHGTSQG